MNRLKALRILRQKKQLIQDDYFTQQHKKDDDEEEDEENEFYMSNIPITKTLSQESIGSSRILQKRQKFNIYYNNNNEDSSIKNKDHTPDIQSFENDSASRETFDIYTGIPPQRQSIIMTCIVGAFVTVGGFLFGYDTGLINGVVEMKYVMHHIAPNHVYFTATQQSVVVSFLSLGTFLGALLSPYIADRYGRKNTIIISTALVFFIGNSLQVAALGIRLFVAGRFISGVAIGIISAVVPLYQAEAAPKKMRGAIISMYQWAITWGLLVSSAVAQGTKHIDSPSSYRIPIGLQYVWAGFLAVGMLFLPESPRFYVLRDELDKAAKSLSFLRGVPVHDSGLLEELIEIKASYDYESSVESSSLKDCFTTSPSRPKQTLRMLTGIALQTFQQFAGINFVFYYGVNFFEQNSVENSYIMSFITYAVNVVFNIPGLILIEYVGRRDLLIVGGILMTICNFIIAGVGCLSNEVISGKVMMAFICCFVASFSATWGGTVWAICAELYPLGVRSKASALCAAANWLSNFVCAFITPYIGNGQTKQRESFGSKIFFIWGACTLMGTIVAYFTVYETSGLTLEEVNDLYKICPSGIQSRKYNTIVQNKGYATYVEQISDRDNLSQDNDTGGQQQQTSLHTIEEIGDTTEEVNEMIKPKYMDIGSDDKPMFYTPNYGHELHRNLTELESNTNLIGGEDDNTKDNNNNIKLTDGITPSSLICPIPQTHEQHENGSITNGSPIDANTLDSWYTQHNLENLIVKPEPIAHSPQRKDIYSNLTYSSFSNGSQNSNNSNIMLNNNNELQVNSKNSQFENIFNSSANKENIENHVNVGNGLSINRYTRGPPSLLSDSSDEDESVATNTDSQQTNMATVNEYMAQLIKSNSNMSSEHSNISRNIHHVDVEQQN